MNYESLHFYEEDLEASHNGIEYFCTVRASGTYYKQDGDYYTPPEEDVLHQELEVDSAYYYNEEDEEIPATPEELKELWRCFDAKELLLSTLN